MKAEYADIKKVVEMIDEIDKLNIFNGIAAEVRDHLFAIDEDELNDGN